MATRTSTTAVKKAPAGKQAAKTGTPKGKAAVVVEGVEFSEAPAPAETPAETPAVAVAPVKAAAKVALPTKKYGLIKLDKLDWERDPTTEQAEWDLVKLPVGDYLASIGVSRNGHYHTDWMVASEVQRTVLRITEKSYKHRMMRHVAQGGPVPPVICAVRGDHLSPLDGLQRSDVFTQVAQALAMRKHDPEAELPATASLAFAKAEALGHVVADLDSFLASKMGVQIWRGLTPDEERKKFGTWNLDLNKVSAKHLTELRLESTRALLDAIGIKTLTEKEAKTPVVSESGEVVRRPRKSKDASAEERVRPLASVQMGLYAYLTGLWNTNKDHVLEEDALAKVQERLTEMPEGMMERDFDWFYLKVMPLLHKRYDASDTPAGKQVTSESETLIVPALAALGWARQELDDTAVETWKSDLVELLELEDVVDPLTLWKGTKSWGEQRRDGALKGSTGQKDRKLTFFGWVYSIGKGVVPIDWVKGCREACNKG